MVTTLSQPERLSAQRALAQWRVWQTSVPLAGAPELVARLSGGRSNTTLLVARGDSHFALRIDGVEHRRLGLSRDAEYRAWKNAAQQALAPLPVYFNPDLGVLVSQWQAADVGVPDRAVELAAVAALLRDIHSLPAIHFRLRPRDRARRYQALCGDSNRVCKDFDAACERLAAFSSQHCLCHNDLLAANRLWHGEKLFALDWEYAAMGDPLFDLAAVCEGDALTDEDCNALLQCYYGDADPPASLAQRLADNRLVYRHLSHLWERATGL